jgi:hypothetical protein
MDESRAVARLRHLDVEIRRRLPEEQAEQLAISRKATSSGAKFAEFLARGAGQARLTNQRLLSSAAAGRGSSATTPRSSRSASRVAT